MPEKVLGNEPLSYLLLTEVGSAPCPAFFPEGCEYIITFGKKASERERHALKTLKKTEKEEI